MNNKGFSFIELMIMVVIIGIVAAIAIPNFINMHDRAKEAVVKSNCHTVQLAVEDFAAQNDGEYPSDVDTDKTPSGQTVKGGLPCGEFLKNPFTDKLTEPVNGMASNPGEVGYSVITQNNFNVGYTITGVGKESGTIIVTLSSEAQ